MNTDIKLRYLSLHVGARLFFSDQVRYYMEEGEKGHSGVFHKDTEYKLSFIILEVLSKNPEALKLAYIILKPWHLLNQEENNSLLDQMNELGSNNSIDILRYNLVYHNDYLGHSPIKEGWAITER